jgi:hypothetical protein
MAPPPVHRPGRSAAAVAGQRRHDVGGLVRRFPDRPDSDPRTARPAGGRRRRDGPRLLTATQVLFAVGWCLALVGAAPVVIRLVLPALRSPARTALRPLLPALVLGMGEIGGLLWLAQVHGGVGAMLSDARLAGVIMWLIGLAAFVACLGLGPAVSLTRLEPGAAQLRVPALAAVPLALTLTALTGCALAAVALAGHGTLFGSGVPVALGLAIACLTSVVALASSVRGVRAARAV